MFPWVLAVGAGIASVAAWALTRKPAPTAQIRYSKEYVVVAHYPEIERTYLKKEYETKGTDEVFNGRMWLSVSQLVWPMVDAQMIPRTSLRG
jgi:hypothetical protein